MKFELTKFDLTMDNINTLDYMFAGWYAFTQFIWLAYYISLYMAMTYYSADRFNALIYLNYAVAVAGASNVLGAFVTLLGCCSGFQPGNYLRWNQRNGLFLLGCLCKLYMPVMIVNFLHKVVDDVPQEMGQAGWIVDCIGSLFLFLDGIFNCGVATSQFFLFIASLFKAIIVFQLVEIPTDNKIVVEIVKHGPYALGMGFTLMYAIALCVSISNARSRQVIETETSKHVSQV